MIALFFSHNLYPLGRVYAQEMGGEEEAPFRVENMIAVLDLNLVGGVNKALTTTLTNALINELVGLKVYDVIDRANRDKILSEQGFQLKDCVEEECRVEAGRMLGVGKIVVGNVFKVGEAHFINIQLINVETGMVEKSAMDKCVGTIDKLVDLMSTLVAKLVGVKIKQEVGVKSMESTSTGEMGYILAGRPFKGPEDAPITIVEYSEFQCPYCRRAAATVGNQVLKNYGDKIKLVFKHFPLGFHKWAEPAAIASECAFRQNNEAFWYFFDKFFENQRIINEGNIREKSLQLAEEANLDKEEFSNCYDNKETLTQVKQDIEEGKSIGLTGVPAFFINGKKLSGAQPYEKFKEVIDEELKGK